MKDRFLESRALAIAAGIVLAHFAVLLLHGAAHRRLSINMRGWENGFIAIVIFLSPILAMALLFVRRVRKAAVILLGGSMLGSLVYGVCRHFFILGPDNVSGMHYGVWVDRFYFSAVLLAATEAAGCIWALWALSAGSGAGATAQGSSGSGMATGA